MAQKLILASSSPRRLEILKNMGFEPDQVISTDIDESPLKKEKPADYCKRMAQEKALAAAQDNKGSFIIAGDTIASVGTRILGKPKDIEGARRMLKLMSGRRHRVYSAISIVSPEGKMRNRMTTTFVKFKNLHESDIEQYLITNHWQGKAGAYGLQEDKGGFIISINGSFSGVIGLPAYEAKSLLLGMGFESES